MLGQLLSWCNKLKLAIHAQYWHMMCQDTGWNMIPKAPWWHATCMVHGIDVGRIS